MRNGAAFHVAVSLSRVGPERLITIVSHWDPLGRGYLTAGVNNHSERGLVAGPREWLRARLADECHVGALGVVVGCVNVTQ